MGIPSYYRQLIQSIPGLLEKLNQYNSLRWCHHLWIDFNCIIYHCINRPQMPTLIECGNKEIYEERLIEEVIAYLDYIINIARPKETIYIAVDGVVPAAKRRQQRMRRWTTNTNDSESNKPSWNKNAITPGTDFMNALSSKLDIYIAKREFLHPKVHWRVSGPNEAGEGEHKIMKQLRLQPSFDYKIHFIYGLDADLILLTILHCAIYHPTESFFLYREELGKDNQIIYNDFLKNTVYQGEDIMLIDDLKLSTEKKTEESLVIFSIELLMKHIAERRATVLDMKNTWTAWMIDYVFIMTLLGNDFVPSYITVSFKDDGHAIIMRLLMGLWDKGLRLVVDAPVAPKYLEESWEWIFKRLSGIDGYGETDEIRFKKLVTKKETAVGKRRAAMCSLVEHHIINVDGELLPDWKDRVYLEFSGVRGSTRTICRTLTTMYKQAMEWILGYYFGDSVNTDWYYSSWITPFAEDAVEAWKEQKMKNYNKKYVSESPSVKVGELDQLALVLPKRDMSLINNCALRKFGESIWFDMPMETKWCEFMKWAEWEKYPKIACPLNYDLIIWKNANQY
jgi:5'-3' exonuclease